MKIFLILLCATISCIASPNEKFSHTKAVISEFSWGNREVMEGAELFLYHVNRCTELDTTKILEATEFAAFKHRNQKRKNPQGTPYIVHPIGVADHLLVVGGVRDTDIVVGALLHDTVEDTETSFEEIREKFGSCVEGYVREVTDDKSLPKMERKALQIVHAPHKSAGAAQIKLADKYYNLNDLLSNPPGDWERERIDAYFEWADRVVHGLPQVNIPLLKAVECTIAAYKESRK